MIVYWNKKVKRHVLSFLENLPPFKNKKLNREQLMEVAHKAVKIIEYDGDVNPLVDKIIKRRDIRVPKGTALVGSTEKVDETIHNQKWVEKLKEDDWYYHNAYRLYLARNNWPPGVADGLIDDNKRILSHMKDPSVDGSWESRGLVVGNVQSGNTANYIGLMAAAADAGYKVIILAAGVHNNIRKQIHRRVDEGFVGYRIDIDGRKKAFGVGEIMSKYLSPISITHAGIGGDVRRAFVDRMEFPHDNCNRPLTFVIKKDANVLMDLRNWLRDMNERSDGQVFDLPLLFIDDETDSAHVGIRTGYTGTEVDKFTDSADSVETSIDLAILATPPLLSPIV